MIVMVNYNFLKHRLKNKRRAPACAEKESLSRNINFLYLWQPIA